MKSIFKKSSLFRNFIENGSDFFETVKVFELETEKKGLTKKQFKKFNKSYLNYELKEIENYVNCCCFFGLDFMKDFYDYLFNKALEEKFLERIVFHWYFEEKIIKALKDNIVFSDEKRKYMIDLIKPKEVFRICLLEKYPDSVETLIINNITEIMTIDNGLFFPILKENPQIKKIKIIKMPSLSLIKEYKISVIEAINEYNISEIEECALNYLLDHSYFTYFLQNKSVQEKKDFFFKIIKSTVIDENNQKTEIKDKIINIFVLLEKVGFHEKFNGKESTSYDYKKIFEMIMENETINLKFSQGTFIINNI